MRRDSNRRPPGRTHPNAGTGGCRRPLLPVWLLPLVPGFVAAQELGPAPWLADPDRVPSVRAPRNAGQANAIDTAHRGEVIGHFHSRWMRYLDPTVGWTGTLNPCVAGTTDQGHRNAVIESVNYYRAMAHLPDTLTLDGTRSGKNQQAALVYAATGDLSHYLSSPPPNVAGSWKCLTADATEAALNSNIALGLAGPDAIDAYMDDYGGGNTAVGHRRWILYPRQLQIGTGDVEGPGVTWRSNALWVLGPWTTAAATPNGTPWPPSGYVPWQILPAGSNRWSFSYPAATFTGATVTMTEGATTYPVTYEAVANGYGDNTLVWKPTGFAYTTPAADRVVNVAVNNVTVGGTPRNFAYTVTIVNPVKPPRLMDYNGDGMADLTWFNAGTGQFSQWFMDLGVLSGSAASGVGGGWQPKGVGDFDGDGKADVVWTHVPSGQAAIWFMNGGSFAKPAAYFSPGPGWTPAAVGDYNGDGKADITWRHSSGQVVTWLMNGSAILSAHAQGGVDANWEILGSARFTASAKASLVWRYAPTGDLFHWSGADTTTPQLNALGRPGSTWQPMAIADFDGDGLDDIFWRDAIGVNAIWRSGLVGQAVFLPGVGLDWSPRGAAQIYGDGRANVVWQRNDGLVATWRFNAALSPSVSFVITVPAGWTLLTR